MNFNKLLYDHQMALMKGAAETPPFGKRSLVYDYEKSLRTARKKLGVAQYPAFNMRNPALTSSTRKRT